MAAVIRVKRPLHEEPLEALVINCKRRKTQGDTVEIEDSQLSAVLKFAATIKSQDEDIFEHVRNSSKTEAKESFKKHVPNLYTKLKQETQSSSKNSRYKVINCFRSNPNTLTDVSNNEGESYTVFDIEYDHENVEPEKKSLVEAQYVYDLYYTNSDDFEDTHYNDVSIYPLSDHLVFGSYRDNGVNEDDSDCSEDSNAENNWRNDYPDESDMESVNEEDMVKAVQRCTLEEDDLSSDDGEDDYVYGCDSEGMSFEGDIDESDEKRYGKLYARFKAKVKNMEKNCGVDRDLYYGDIDEEAEY